MSLVFCGTESPDVLSLKFLPDGKVEITQRLPVSSNPLALKYGSPGGIAVEWDARRREPLMVEPQPPRHVNPNREACFR